MPKIDAVVADCLVVIASSRPKRVPDTPANEKSTLTGAAAAGAASVVASAHAPKSDFRFKAMPPFALFREIHSL